MIRFNNNISQQQIPTYHDFRQQILDIATKKKLHIHSIEFDKGPQGKPLYSDILSTPIDPDKPTYLMIAGCHGVEGYLGSLIFRKYLQAITPDQLSRINLVIIHPLCPYGMAWYRRVNAQNIDLNRNFFTTDERPVNRGFEALVPLLNSRTKMEFAGRVLLTSLNEGYIASRRILGQGQYEFSDKPFYGGHNVQEETLQVLGYIKALLVDVHQMCIFDIHSGLGKPGVEMILGLEAYSVDPQTFRKNYPDKKFASLKEESWECTGTFGEAIKHFFQDVNFTYIVQEFGTAGNLFVLYTLMKDHQDFDQQKNDPKRIKQMLKAFFLFDPHLQNFAMTQAFKTYELVTGLDVKPDM